MSDDAFLQAEIPIGGTLTEEIKTMSQHLLMLQLKMDELAEQAKAAKLAYEDFKFNVLPTKLTTAGLSSLVLDNGVKIALKQNVYCSPNKNAPDKKKMAEWLGEHGGEFLMKKKAVVDGAFIDQLTVPFVEENEANTNSLKAWFKDQLGLNGGTPQFTVEEIPSVFHFYVQPSAEITE